MDGIKQLQQALNTLKKEGIKVEIQHQVIVNGICYQEKVFLRGVKKTLRDDGKYGILIY